ncbi:hypothetical protein [Dactylosporangium salmoneum]|uniref:Uncharacterized protein n=1 Tax=Dactylosporangium salmoneum TaxID=53361 RepID=A0ABP5U6L6_9ACTN
MARADLHVAEADASVEHGRDERMSEHVRVHPVDGMVELEPSGSVRLLCQLLDFHWQQAGWNHLDRHVRQWFAWHAAVMDTVVGRLEAGTAGPVSWVLAGIHPDGRIRQRAIDIIGAGPWQ